MRERALHRSAIRALMTVHGTCNQGAHVSQCMGGARTRSGSGPVLFINSEVEFMHSAMPLLTCEDGRIIVGHLLRDEAVLQVAVLQERRLRQRVEDGRYQSTSCRDSDAKLRDCTIKRTLDLENKEPCMYWLLCDILLAFSDQIPMDSMMPLLLNETRFQSGPCAMQPGPHVVSPSRDKATTGSRNQGK